MPSSPEVVERRRKWDNVLDAENELRRFVLSLTPKGVFGSEDLYNEYHERVHNYRVAVEAHCRTTIVR